MRYPTWDRAQIRRRGRDESSGNASPEIGPGFHGFNENGACTILLNLSGASRSNLRIAMTTRLKKTVKTLDPFIIIMLGLVALASVLPVRGQPAKVAEILTNCAITLLFFLHGAKLSRASIIEGVTNWKLQLVVFGCTFILFPILGLLLQLGLSGPVSPLVMSGILFVCLLPSTVQSSIAFTGMAGGNIASAVCSASLSNFLGIFLTPVLVALLMHQSANFAWSSVEKIALQLLLPFILGHLARPLLVGLLTAHKMLVSRVDRTSILMVVYTAFSASVVQGIWKVVRWTDIAIIFALSAILLSAVMGIAFVAGRAFGFSKPDRIAILFCGSKKSLASGVPMASTLFPSATLGVMVLPLMIFHQLQLIVCSFIASRYGAEARQSADAVAPDGQRWSA